MSGPQLMGVHSGLPVHNRNGGRGARARQLAEPSGRPGLDGAGSCHSGGRSMDGLDVHRDVVLGVRAGFFGDGVGSFIACYATVLRHPLEEELSPSRCQSAQ